MEFSKGLLYHVYNRGNNKQPIFFKRDHYLYFLEKVNKYLFPNADILSWCLMPNHFHFLIHATAATEMFVRESPCKITNFAEGIRLLLSSYTKGIQKQWGYTGNLFQQRTKSKCVTNRDEKYGEITFHYIHQNPVRAGLVRNMEDWEFSSFRDYAGLRNGKLCNQKLASELFNLDLINFVEMSYQMLPEQLAKKIF